MNNEKNYNRIADFLFEIGTMRKIPRAHRQSLLTDDMTDNISSHSYRVAMIGWTLAKEEGADPYKVVMMCLMHDLAEIRSNDHNYVHKRYVKVFDDEIARDQLGTLPHNDLKEMFDEYEERESLESVIAKDADLVDQVLLIREYAWKGNQEAQRWLDRMHNDARIQTKSAQKIAETILNRRPSEWFDDISTSENR